MSGNQPPQTPQPPQPPLGPPPGAKPGTTTVIVKHTVTGTGNQDRAPPPRTPSPATASAGSAQLVTSIADAIGPETQFEIQIGISTIEIDGETIIHDDLRNTNHRLNASGSFIWSRITPKISFANLLTSIDAAHSVVPETSPQMVAQFLADLISRGVLGSTVATTP